MEKVGTESATAGERCLSSSVPSQSKGKRRAISAKYKLEAVHFAEQTSNAAAARKFIVDRKQIQTWRKMKSTLEKVIAIGCRYQQHGQQ